MEKEAWLLFGALAVLVAGVMYALNWNAGDLSRQEEEENAE